jgi:hypothetical protein
VCISNFGGTATLMGGVGRRLFQAGGNSFNNLPSYGEYCGTYQCVCGGVGWTETLNATKCSRCLDPCEKVKNRDPCGILGNSENRCITKPGTRPGQEEAGGFGPQPSNRRLMEDTNDTDNAESATRRQYDYNGYSWMMGNPSAYPAQVGGITNQISENLPVCGDYTCLCAQNSDWSLSADERMCVRDCSNKCLTSDPCNNLLDARNTCTYVPKRPFEDCGHHVCTCAPGWTRTFGGQACQAPQPSVNPCVANGDPCMTKEQPYNTCTEDATHKGLYFCTCSAVLGYLAGTDDLTCFPEAPQPGESSIGPCSNHDYCKVEGNDGNFCTEYGVKYVCTCAAAGFKVAPDGQTCR